MPGVQIGPAYDDVSAGWRLVDNVVMDMSTRPAGIGAGTCMLEFPRLGATEMWLIDHAVVMNTAPGTVCRWYFDTPEPHNLITGSDAGTFDEGDWPAGLMIPPGVALVVQWSNVANAAVGTCKLQVRKCERRAGR